MKATMKREHMINFQRPASDHGSARRGAAVLVSCAAMFAPFAMAGAQETPAPAAPQIDPQRIIARADANNDGDVSKSELTALRAKMAGRLDRNSDGVIDENDAQRFRRRRANMEQRIREVTSGFDLNGDGVIEVEEFINGPTLIFDMIDTDANGVVSAAELETAHAAFQARQAQAEAATPQ